MPARTDEKTRKQVINDWLSGIPRDEIATTHKLGSGTVTGIVKEWQNGLNNTDYDAIREVAVDLRRRKLNFKDASHILRLYNKTKQEGIRADNIEEFLANIEAICIEERVSAREIVSMCRQMLTLSKDENVLPERIPELLDQKIKELKGIHGDIETFTKEKEQSDQQRLAALKQKDITEEAIQEYVNVRSSLKDHGLLVTNVKALLTLLDNCQKLDNDPAKVVAKLSVMKDMQGTINQLEKQTDMLEQKKKIQEDEIKEKQRLIIILEEQLAAVGSLVSSVARLREKKIADHHVISLAEIISSYGSASIDIGTLLEDLKQYKSVGALNEVLTRRNAELKAQEQSMSENVKYLQSLKDDLGQTIENLVAMTDKQIERVRMEAINSTNQVSDAKCIAVPPK